MGTLRHRLAVPATGVLVLAAGLGGAVTAAHAASPPAASDHSVPRRPPVIDGFTLTHLPDALGSRTSEHTYTWGDVGFRNLVWESQLPNGAYRVDLNAHILRGDRLTDHTSLHQFLTDYLERDPDTWQPTEVQLGNRTVHAAETDVFWLVRPGVAVWLSTRPGRLDRTDLLTTAEGIREIGQQSPTDPP
ncbi:MAG: hypothetical protein GEV07_13900 [Streptosporangiales bacterium]|nr:hypothetical protein [Streptosporangiales bacterium]